MNNSDTIRKTSTSTKMEKSQKLVSMSNLEKLKTLYSLLSVHSSFPGNTIRRRLSYVLRNSPVSFSTPMEDLFSKLTTFAFLISTIKELLPTRFSEIINKFWSKVFSRIFNGGYMQITFHEYMNNSIHNEAYNNVKSYLANKSSNESANYLKAEKSSNSKSLVLSLNTGEEIIDVFERIKFKWKVYKEKITTNSSSSSSRSVALVEKNCYVLTLYKKDKDLVINKYLNYVMKEGKDIEVRNKKRKLYTNKSSCHWSCIDFEHPATFDSIAMESNKKQEIINDLIAFREGKEYYASIGKAWKRGYLLYGPPGTGKSTMISAIANYLHYDIYDLELTSVRDNSKLKNLLIDTRGKSIIVIEDIDCSIGLTGKRKVITSKEKNIIDSDADADSDEKKMVRNVTLSGLLNFIDGIWSACGHEKIIIFTTNHIEKLDPALIRRGRMDMHIEMSYCRYEAFKVLAKNYLGIDEHYLFEEIDDLLKQVNMSPCDVAENLMPKTFTKDVEVCLKSLIQACKVAKEKAKLKKKKKKENEDICIQTSSQMPLKKIQQVEDRIVN